MKNKLCKLAAARGWNSIRPALAFTLIELLVVISIISVIAAFTLPVMKSLKRQQYIKNAQAELALLETAIERYHAAYGFYPPDSAQRVSNIPINQLYFELLGTTITNGNYVTLDSSAQMPLNQVSTAYGVGGFMNCTKSGAAEDSAAARSFIAGLKPKQIGVIPNGLVATTALLCAVGGPDPTYMPFGVADINPWRYNSSNPTNNPGSYDLYVQLVISGKTNLICNWSKAPIINSPLP